MNDPVLTKRGADADVGAAKPAAEPSAGAPLAGTPPAARGGGNTWGRSRRIRSRSSLFAAGEPMVWLTGGALVICAAMVVGLLALVFWKGGTTFWPLPVDRLETADGRVYMGEITRTDRYQPGENVIRGLPPEVAEQAATQLADSDGWARRRLVRTGNFRLTQEHFRWVSDYELAAESHPEWAVVMERLEWGRFYGFPEAFVELTFVDGAEGAEAAREAARRLLGQLPEEPGREPRLLVERFVDGRDRQLLVPADELDGVVPLAVASVVTGPEAAWALYREHHGPVRERWRERQDLEEFDTGEVNHELEQSRLAVREAEIELADAEEEGGGSAATNRARERLEAARERYEEVRSWADQEFRRIRREIDEINRENARFQLLMRTAGEGGMPPQETLIRLDDVVRAYPANRVSALGKAGIYLSRWREFLTDEPREANSEGGVFPAIFGTVAMTLIMSLAVVPFGVLAALYLREYARAGPLVSAVRIAVNNLAGVPSIVFGVFGLGFFCYLVGASLDELLFAAHLPNPTYGKGGLMWASLTLALLTLPVVIVATEEAVSAVPNSMREGSYACGASKWQTIQRIVLPRATPGIITGMILAIARGAGEVAPLMLVGAVKLAPELPIDSIFPYVHPERSFMHLGFHIYDVGFQSQNSEAAKPMVFTTTLLLIALVASLNLAAIWLRNRLRKRFEGGQF